MTPSRTVSAEVEQITTLTIPAAPELVGTARLTILGVTARLNLSYDAVEDIRLAVGEACTQAIDRYAGYSGSDSEPAELQIRCRVRADRLTIEVTDHAGQIGQIGQAGETTPSYAVSATDGAADGDVADNQELGALLMEILVDEAEVESLPDGGTCVRLIKYLPEAEAAE